MRYVDNEQILLRDKNPYTPDYIKLKLFRCEKQKWREIKK